MGGKSLFSGLSDAQTTEREGIGISEVVAPETKLNPLAAAFMGQAEPTTETSSFAQALGDTTQTETAPTFGTEDFAQALENQPVTTETLSSTPEYESLFGLAQKMELEDQEKLLALRAEIETHTAKLVTAISEAKAQNPNAANEETKILMAQQTGTEGVYYVNFLHQARITVEHFIKLLRNLITNSAGEGASWTQTRAYHNRQRDELKLTAQAAG